MNLHTRKTKRNGYRKLFVICLTLLLLLPAGAVRASGIDLTAQTVTAKFTNMSLNDVIWELQKQTDFTFIYSTNDVKNIKVKNVVANNEVVTTVLDKCLENSGLTYTIHNGVVAIKKAAKPAAEVAAPQQKSAITGTVVDQHGEPMPGVNVLVKGTSTGAITDIDGNFAVSIDGTTATLAVSFVGFVSREVKVTAGKSVEIILEEDAVMVDEVVVVAYGEQKRSSFTGSAAVVTSETIARRPVSNVLNAIEGSAPGVQIQSSSGAPDAGVSFRIRGVGSLNAGRDPLIVLDGVPYESGLNNLNPNDVESVTVLKDAASTAIYGARGGNGVVLITTKNAGKQEKISVTFNAKLAVSKVRGSDLYDVIKEPGEYYEQHYRALYNYYQNVMGYSSYEANREANASWTNASDKGGLGYDVFTYPEGEGLIGYNGKLNPNATLGRVVTGEDGKQYMMRPDDWLDETYKTGFRQDYSLSLKGGTDKLSMLASAGYTKDTGITEAAQYERFTGRLKGTFNAKKWLKVNGSLDLAKSTTNSNTDHSYNSNNIFSNVNTMAPIYPIFIRDVDGNYIYDDNGKVYDYGDGKYNAGNTRPRYMGSNRLQEALIQTRRTESVKVGANVAAIFQITPELTATLSLAYDERDRRYTSTSQPFYGTSHPGGSVSVYHYKNESINQQQLINYIKSFGSHNFKFTLLHEFYEYRYFQLSGNKSQMVSYFENQELDGAITMNDVGSHSTRYMSEGYGGRMLYDYNGIYSFDASFRRDASTNFHSAHRWGNFFSFGGAYLMSKEEYFNVPWVDMLKLKLSYGQNGNDKIGAHRYVKIFDIVATSDGIGLKNTTTSGNSAITWETRGAINAGVEFEMFRGRLRGGLEYYYNKTTDMLASVRISAHTGSPYSYANVGDMRNAGFEFDLSGDIIRTRDFKWNMNINGSMNKTKILELAEVRKGETLYDVKGNEVTVGYNSGDYFQGIGQEYKTWYLKKFAGINEAGQPTWYVRDDDGTMSTTTTYSSASYLASGSSQPKILGGFGGSLSWKSLELSFRFSYRLGGYAYDYGYASLMTVPTTKGTGTNFHKDIYKSWTPQNPNNQFARWQFDDQYFTSRSDRWLTKADYLNLQNITLSYIVPKKEVRKWGIEGLTASLGVDDLFFLSKRKGFIPSRDFDGDLTMGYYPNTRRILLNLKFDF